MKRFFILIDDAVRARAKAAIDAAPEGYAVTVSEPTRNLQQNAKFHAMCGDIARQAKYLGKALADWQWKVLFVSGHTIATKGEAEIVPGLEGEFVNIRESTARMSVKRLASVTEYVQAWAANQGIRWGRAASHA